MTSLCPGPLFATPGLNNYSTPSSRTATSAEINNRFTRLPFNGIPWPRASPVSQVYDVQNSSTKMILLNNKYSKKGCRLRGQTLNEGHVKSPDPARHSAEMPYVNRRSHLDCVTSSTPQFKPEIKTSLRWANASQRPPLKFEDGSSVNSKRHTACMVTEDLRLMNWQRPRRPYSRSIVRECMHSQNPLLEDLSPGERMYMYSIARVYSVDAMRRTKQNQYFHILQREAERGVHPNEEVRRYLRYLSSQRKTQQGSMDTYQRRRIQSAPANRLKSQSSAEHEEQGHGQRGELRPHSTRSMARYYRPGSRASTVSSKSYKKSTQGEGHPNDVDRQKKTSRSRTEETKTSDAREEQPKTTATGTDQRDHSETDHIGTGHKVTISTPDDQDSSQKEVEVRGYDKSTDSDVETLEPLKHSKHKEGGDRPKSRFGVRPGTHESDNSDDDYSSDSSSTSSSDQYGRGKYTKKSRPKSDTSSLSSSSSSQKTGSKSKLQSRTDPLSSEDTTESSATQSKLEPKSDSDVTGTSQSESQSKTTSSKKKSAKKFGDHSDASSRGSKSSLLSSTSDSTTENTSSQKTSSRTKTTSDSEDTTYTSTSNSDRSTDASKSKDPSSASDPKGKVSNDEVKDPKDKKVSNDDVKDPQNKVSSDEVKDANDKVSSDEVKASTESYSEDTTQSSSKSESKETPSQEVTDETSEAKAKEDEQEGEVQKTDSKDLAGDGSGYSKDRRDSVEQDREERVKDWDKIEY